MAEKDKRKVKQINGWKVNHPFSFGNVFNAILSLILAALPVAYIFIPVVALHNGAVITPWIMGVDLLTGFFNKFYQAGPENILQFFAAGGQKIQFFGPYLMIAQTSLMLLSFALSLVSFVLFMINICKGYLRHAKIARLMSIMQFIVALLFAISWIVDYIFIFLDTGTFPNFFIWWNFVLMGGVLIHLIATCITYSNTYRDVIFEADLEYHSDGEKEVVTHVTEVHNVTKVKYEPANTLPPNLISIGGHAFSENQYLEIANVPLGITSLGGGAFANCLKLKVVSLPEDIKEIGFNCFFNCVSLERINFAGTKEQWRHIRRGSNWLAKAKTTQVVCIDGPIVVNPYH